MSVQKQQQHLELWCCFVHCQGCCQSSRASSYDHYIENLCVFSHGSVRGLLASDFGRIVEMCAEGGARLVLVVPCLERPIAASKAKKLG
jgi:hypothetical protein